MPNFTNQTFSSHAVIFNSERPEAVFKEKHGVFMGPYAGVNYNLFLSANFQNCFFFMKTQVQRRGREGVKTDLKSWIFHGA